MAKDYAKKTRNSKSASRGTNKRRKPAVKNNSRSGIWLMAGVILGIGAAGLFYLNQHPVDLFKKHAIKAVRKREEIKTAKAEVPKQPEFDFYTILPKQKVWEPGDAQENQNNMNAPVSTAASQNQGGNTSTVTGYILQLAAFKNYPDADSLKAKLILQGLPANTDAKPVNGWTRVWLGPFKTLPALQAAQSQIATNDKMNGMVIPLH